MEVFELSWSVEGHREEWGGGGGGSCSSLEARGMEIALRILLLMLLYGILMPHCNDRY